MPEWIVQLWVAAYGEKETLSYLAAALGQAPSGIRVNLLRTGHKSLLNEFKQMQGVHFVAPAAFALPTGNISGNASGNAFEARSARRSLPIKNLLAAGRISRQSAAAYEALSAMRPEDWAQPVWDACAGRGGKSMALLEQGVSVARVSDASEARLQGFSQEFQRLFPQEASGLPDSPGASGLLSSSDSPDSSGAPGKSAMPLCPEIILSKAQLTALNDVRENTRKFGTILLDVPCSGLGTLARRPEIRWRRTPEDIRRLCAGQDELLDMADSVLKTGGSIVYLTCTLNPAENQERIEAFCKRHKDFKLEKEWQTPPDTTLGEFFWAVELRKG
jgi:16S rRNA (cytosine967-C5)-methyltransferase